MNVIVVLLLIAYSFGRAIFVVDDCTIKEYIVLVKNKTTEISAYNFDFLGKTNVQHIDLLSIEKYHFSVAQQFKDDDYKKYDVFIAFFIVLVFVVIADILVFDGILRILFSILMKYGTL